MTGPVRVLVTAEQLQRRVPGGVGTYVSGLLLGLARLDRRPDVAVWAARGAPDRAEGWPAHRSRLPVRLLTMAWDRGLCRPPAVSDLVHATSLAVPPAGGRPLTAFVHDVAWRRVPDAFPSRGRRWHEAALRRAARRARLLIVPSRATADDLLASGIAAERVVIVEEGCDHLPPPDHEGAAAVLRSRGVEHGYLLAVATLEPRKNLARLLHAFRLARPDLPEPWPLVVVGPAGWGEQVVPPPGVVLTGPVPAAVLAALYAGARAVAYVPLAEGFGLPAVEAMLACVPVVASDVPSTGGAAIEVDPLDVEAIADALVRAATDEALRAERVTAGLLRAEELSWETAARRHVEAWEQAMVDR